MFSRDGRYAAYCIIFHTLFKANSIRGNCLQDKFVLISMQFIHATVTNNSLLIAVNHGNITLFNCQLPYFRGYL